MQLNPSQLDKVVAIATEQLESLGYSAEFIQAAAADLENLIYFARDFAPVRQELLRLQDEADRMSEVGTAITAESFAGFIDDLLIALSAVTLDKEDDEEDELFNVPNFGVSLYDGHDGHDGFDDRDPEDEELETVVDDLRVLGVIVPFDTCTGRLAEVLSERMAEPVDDLEDTVCTDENMCDECRAYLDSLN